MAKVAFRYMKVEPWSVTEEGFDPTRARISESIFSLANEFMGVRGYFEEGYSGDHLQGSYFGGLYENKEIGHPQVFKGFVTRENFIVNAVDWLYVRLTCDGQTLDLARSKFSDFVRSVDMKTGVLTRQFVWHVAPGKRIRVRFERFLSMAENTLACQRITLEALDVPAEVVLRAGLNFETAHEISSGWRADKVTGAEAEGPKERYWEVLRKQAFPPPFGQVEGGLYAIQARTRTTKFAAFSSFRLRSQSPLAPRTVEGPEFIGCDAALSLAPGRPVAVEKVVCNFWERPSVMSPEDVWRRGMDLAHTHAATTFDLALKPHADYWSAKWTNWDITIDGADDLQQGLRYDLFQFHMAYHGGDERLAIPSKGLTAEVYSGWIFWVVETYCQHVMIFTDPVAARKLLRFRYLGLPGAIERAGQVDCRGARYPFCTIDGPESCATWQHADMEIHVGEGIYRAIELYVLHTGDKEFLYNEGIEMLLQICRYYASRGGWSPTKKDFGFYGVMGPDEYHTVVSHNCYTNLMARKCFEYTLSVIDEMKKEAPDKWRAARKKVALEPQEPRDWKKMARKMRIPRDRKTGVYEQHAGYFDLPEVDVQAIGPDQIPIYTHWAYERILRTGMVKQADVLLLPVWFAHEWTLAEKKANFDFYEPRTIHESSFSPSIHQILAAELGRDAMAEEYFRYMARLDLDDYHQNTAQGLHMTPKSGTWLCVTYGFAGMRTDLPVLTFAPTIPKGWNGYRFRIVHRGSRLEVSVRQDGATFRVVEGPDLAIQVYGRDVTATRAGVTVPLQAPGVTLSAGE